jgi:trans-aconitate methyltransferase
VSKQFDKNKKINTLSFGCSSGEECFSQKEYFDKYEVVGADICPMALEEAKKNNTNPNISFFQSTDKNISKNGPYDIIYCMSVLCRWPDSKGLEDITEVYKFSDFEKRLEFLHKNLNPQGCLVLYNTNFRFSDSVLYDQYDHLKLDVENGGFVHKFDVNNKRVHAPYKEIIFKKKLL